MIFKWSLPKYIGHDLSSYNIITYFEKKFERGIPSGQIQMINHLITWIEYYLILDVMQTSHLICLSLFIRYAKIKTTLE